MQPRPAPRDPIPVTVLTGFLGSGKTTLLAALLRRPELAETAVIVNEFGEIGLDHLLVANGDESVVLLDSGCLCCAVSNSLAETLADLDFRAVRGEIPIFKRAVVETSGLADPAPILQTIMTDYLVSARYLLDGIVTAVDGVLGGDQLDSHDEALRQVAIADRLVITKSDIAEQSAIAALRKRLAALNPGAPQIEAVRGAIDPVQLFNIGLYDSARKSVEVQRWLRDEACPPADAETARDHTHRHERISAFSAYVDGPVNWVGYAAWIEALRALHGPDLLRIKGLLAIEDAERPYIIQAVQHMFSPPMRLRAWPSPDRRSRLVFITRDLSRAALAATLKLLHDPAAFGPKRWPRRHTRTISIAAQP